ncbi:hypothetical protein RM543_07460 [Roseicyclus sp. F158]|uniref:DUF2909 domain-containing protein n=1 Tax=Tropicimonas omnivorans TaxID=3075590 RepID=A0ABU3DFN3_9RHOB|nr:hypothetical protein [Roseicyclus sp. F158]MDT0682516.1 hypothetical protein [Roseicyclus sp. F158]
MRFVIFLGFIALVGAALLLGIVAAGRLLLSARDSQPAEGPIGSGTVQKVAFGILWLLVAGVSTGLIGAE